MSFEFEDQWESTRLSRIKRFYRIAIYGPICLSIFFDFIARFTPDWSFQVLGISANTAYQLEILALTVGAFFWVYRYLQFGETDLSFFTRLFKFPLDWQKEISTLKNHEVTAGQASEKETSTNKKLDDEIPSEPRPVSQIISLPTKRLIDEADRLGRRNNMNLAFGLVITGAGLWLLYSTIYDAKIPHTTDFFSFAITYLPRLTLVIFIEVFAYFFLGLYKKGLADIKYFQNEITNVESKAVALEAALFAKNDEIISRVINNIVETERNHILEKGQTTVELEVAKNESASMRQFIKAIPAFSRILASEAKEEKK